MAVGPRTWKTKTGEIKKAYRVKYTNPVTGKIEARQFNRRKDADEFNKNLGTFLENLKIQSGSTRPSHNDLSQMTFREAANKWLVACEKGLGEHVTVERSTLVYYKINVNTHLLNHLDQEPIGSITTKKIKEVRDNLILKCRTRLHAKKILTTIKQIMNEAVENEWIPSNPASNVKVRLDKREKNEVQIPQPDEIRAVLSKSLDMMNGSDGQLAHAHRRYYPMLMTFVTAGLRSSELRGLPWTAIDTRNNRLKVIRRADAWNTLGPPKSRAGYRLISIPDVLLSALDEWRSHCPKSDHDLVFPNWQGNVEAATNLRKRFWRSLQTRASILGPDNKPLYTIHALRHFRASALIASGVDLKRLQVEMGHATLAMTVDTYGHLFTERPEDGKLRADKYATDYLGWVGPTPLMIEGDSLPIDTTPGSDED